MSKGKELAKNIGVLTLSQLGTKILTFLLLPLYTSILTTSEYGIYDLFNTTIGLLVPFLTLNIKDSTMRFSLDKDNSKEEIFSVSIHACLRAIIIAVCLIFFNDVFNISIVIGQYKLFVILLFVTNSIGDVINNFTRGLDRLNDIAIAGVIGSATIITLNIVFLVPLKMGLVGYFLANILGSLFQSLYLSFRTKCWRYIKLVKFKNSKLKKDMYGYAIPLIANSTCWWINSVSDRYIVTWICGVAINGIYSVAGKIPTIIDVFQNIFSQAWTLSVVKHFDKDDKGGFITNTFNVYSCLITIVCSVLIVFSKIMSSFLYSKDFFLAWKYVPFLLIASTLGAMSGYMGGIFAAVKDSKTFAYSTMAGAATNIILNLILVFPFGALGAAFATSISYLVIFWARVYFALRTVEIKVNVKQLVLTQCLLFAQSFIFLCIKKNLGLLYLGEAACLLLIILLFKDAIKDNAKLLLAIILKRK